MLLWSKRLLGYSLKCYVEESKQMQQYLDLVQSVLRTGTRKENRTGVDTLSTFGHYYEVDLAYGFPLLTTKQISWKNIVCELLWFLSGQTDISILKRHGCKFWDAWADPETGLVPSAYGNFWRQFPVHGVFLDDNCNEFGDALGPPIPKPTIEFNDQIRWVIDELNRNPMSRRMVVSAWAPGNAQTSKLPPCHSIFMLNVQNRNIVHYVPEEGRTDRLVPSVVGTKQRVCLHLTQRSADVGIGIPFNIASYALLLSLFSRFSGIEPGIFGHTLVDAHVYTAKPDGSMAEYDHVPVLKEQLTRKPKDLPKLIISDQIKTLSDVEALMHPSVTTEEVMKHFVLEGYDPWPTLKMKVAV